ncbi:meckelin-like [Gigantopelta aegis]|uniref:meckelin-like n=1 Tax=Gigantopelta aegis TaxID=1735272 RepID=UPI001B88A526|nr:meckelin-like [Gigantopelta aegis]
MASMTVLGIFVWIHLFSFVRLQIQQEPSIDYIAPKDCAVGQSDLFHEFFDFSSMSCVKCADNSTVQTSSDDRFNCICRPGYRYIMNFGGRKVKCEKCATSEIVSDDGWECLKSTAKSCGNREVFVEREIDGAWNITETKVCKACFVNTSLNAAQDRCIRCSDFLYIRPELTACTCDSETNAAGGLCFKKDDAVVTSGSQMFEIPLVGQGTSTSSFYFLENIQAAEVLCRRYRKFTSCQQLANMCVLLLYDVGSSQTGSKQACTFFSKIQDPLNEIYKPMLFYTGKADDAVINNDIPTSYTFTPASVLKYTLAAYNIDGNFLGMKSVTGGLLQLCNDSEKKLNAAFRFGTVYSQSCSITAKTLWDQSVYPLVFYDPYLEYTESGKKKLYKIPVLVTNYRDTSSRKPNEGDMDKWKLVRRFFMVDNVATIPKAADPALQSVKNASYVRYVKSMTLVVVLQGGTTEGKINPPYMRITYGEVESTAAAKGAEVQVSFRVTYDMDQSKYNRNFQIATGTLCTLGVLYAGYRAWVWSKRDGRIAIDFPTIINFICYLAASLSNVMFVVTFGIAFYWLIFYKRQDAVFLVHPTGMAVQEWRGLFGSAFALKCLSILHLIFSQCFIDIFFIDWERPKSGEKNRKSDGSLVSIWRTYFVANEWNELQTSRKINNIFQIFSVVFFLSVVGFENVTTMDPNGQVIKDSSDYRAQESEIYRYAVAALTYILVALVQWLFYTFFYEQFIEDRVGQFVDLCSMCNISIFILANAEYGYYIHGRSVHGRSDTDMKEMSEMLKKEENNLVGRRGLEPDTDEQTFQMRIPKTLREKYRNAFQSMALANMNRQQSDATRYESYSAINRLLAAFIDHSLRNIDYTVRPKTWLEGIMDTEFIDITAEKGILYNDNGHSFDKVLFFGHEFTLITFEILLFCTVDMLWNSYILAGVLTYVISEFVSMVRESGGKRNIVRKTLVDKRFLI